MRTAEKKARKEIFGTQKDTFNNFLVKDLTYEEGVKMRDFWHYCHKTLKCSGCGKQKLDTRKGYLYSLVMQCSECLTIMQLADGETRKMVRWFDELMLDRAGVSFSEGWPPLIEMPDSMPLNPKKPLKPQGTFTQDPSTNHII